MVPPHFFWLSSRVGQGLSLSVVGLSSPYPRRVLGCAGGDLYMRSYNCVCVDKESSLVSFFLLLFFLRGCERVHGLSGEYSIVCGRVVFSA